MGKLLSKHARDRDRDRGGESAAIPDPLVRSGTQALERAIVSAGPAPFGSQNGAWETFAAWFNGVFWRRAALSASTPNAEIFLPDSPGTHRVLVVCPPLRSGSAAPNVKPLVRMALDRGWTVIVHVRGSGLEDAESLMTCVDHARSRTSAPLGVIGLSVGAFEACKAMLADARVVSISNGYDLTLAEPQVPLLVHKHVAGVRAERVSDVFGPLSCVDEIAKARSPTLLVNSRNDPLVPACCVALGESLARNTALVSSVTTPRGGHVGFVGPGGRRWAYELALEFCET